MGHDPKNISITRQKKKRNSDGPLLKVWVLFKTKPNKMTIKKTKTKTKLPKPTSQTNPLLIQITSWLICFSNVSMVSWDLLWAVFSKSLLFSRDGKLYPDNCNKLILLVGSAFISL